MPGCAYSSSLHVPLLELRGACRSRVRSPHSWGRPEAGCWKPQYASERLCRRSGASRSGLSPRRHQARGWGGVLRQGAGHCQPAAQAEAVRVKGRLLLLRLLLLGLRRQQAERQLDRPPRRRCRRRQFDQHKIAATLALQSVVGRGLDRLDLAHWRVLVEHVGAEDDAVEGSVQRLRELDAVGSRQHEVRRDQRP